MANRRLVSKNILYSDNFSTISPEALKLYIYMMLEADDDGFVGNMRQVLKIAEVDKDLLDTLIDKGYVIRFNSGVCVIAHWLIHNITERIGYTPTEYLAERAQVYVNDEKIYSML